MIGIIGKKLGMTQIFNEAGQQIPCTVIEAEPNPVLAVTDKAKAGIASVQLGYRRAAHAPRVDEGRETPRGRRAHKAAVGHAKKAGLDARAARAPQLPSRRAGQREGRDPDVQRRRQGRRSTIFAAGEHGEGHRHVEGPRLPGRREALGLRRRSEHARQHEAPPSRLDRTRHRSVARHQGQEDAGPLRRRAAHADAPSRREDRRGAQSDLHPRLRRRSDERDRHRAEAGLSHG